MSSTVPPPKVDFSGMVGPKRRRMRSGGNVSSISNNTPKNQTSSTTPLAANSSTMSDTEDEKTAQTSKCKGSTTIPIFLKKTYKMIESSSPEVASWTPDGEMFAVKDPDVFAAEVIPQYFDHNKFSSFARQLNFYGFRKMQSKPIRNSDFDANTAKHVTFYNENFKRGRCDLLRHIQRSTRGGGSNSGQNQEREINQLKDKVTNLEKTIQDLHAQQEERMRRLELDMLGRMEQMMLAMQQQSQSQHHQHPQYQHLRSIGNSSVGGPSGASMSADLHRSGGGSNGHRNMNGMSNNGGGLTNAMGESLDPLPYGARGASAGTLSGLAHFIGNHQASIGMKNGVPGPGAPSGIGGPTLPPHPKQKQLPTQNLPGSLSLPPGRADPLRGISALSRGISNLSRGMSAESQGGNAMLGNGFEDKFFSMLMNGENQKSAAGAYNNNNNNSNNVYPTPMSAPPPAPQNMHNSNNNKGTN